MEDNLPELRDIHLPDGVSAWPPGYGWGVLLGIVVLLCLALWLWRKSRKFFALRLLERTGGSAAEQAREMSELLRRICVYRYPEGVSVAGAAWVGFLNAHCRGRRLSEGAARLLAEAPFAKGDYAGGDAAALKDFCRAWIRENL